MDMDMNVDVDVDVEPMLSINDDAAHFLCIDA